VFVADEVMMCVRC